LHTKRKGLNEGQPEEPSEQAEIFPPLKIMNSNASRFFAIEKHTKPPIGLPSNP
jgi:hypothetical protein